MRKNIFLCVITLMTIGLLMGCSSSDKVSDSDDERYEESDDGPTSGLRDVFNYSAYGDFEGVPVLNAFATSQLDVKKDYYKYYAANMLDHDPTTAYVEGVDGDGIGEMVEFDFGIEHDRTTYPITMIKVWPGYQKSQETFENNSVPTKLEFYFGNGEMVTCEVGEDYSGKDPVTVSLAEPVLATHCTMVIADAKPGKKYNDCCISDIEFYSQSTDGMMYYGQNISTGDANYAYEIDAFLEDEMFWSYTTNNIVTELTGPEQLFVVHGGIVYLFDDGKVTAADGLTSAVKWQYDMGGYPSAWDFDDAGNIYLCGYYGPDLVVLDKNGKELRYESDIEGDVDHCFWPCMLVVNKGYNKGKVSIYFDYCDDTDYFGKILTVD